MGLAVSCLIIAVMTLPEGNPVPTLLGGLGLVAFGIAAAVFLTKAKAAIEAFWQAFAAHRGWHCVLVDQFDRPRRFRGFRPFGQGSKRTARYVLIGSWRGMAFEAFTYHWTVSSGKSSHTHFAQVVALPMPLLASLSISPENLGHKVFDALGGEDLDTESDEFSRLFWVRAEDRRRAYDILNPGMMDHLLRIGPVGTWQWHGPWLLRVREGKLRPEDVVPLLEEARGFVDNVPRALLPGRKPMAQQGQK